MHEHAHMNRCTCGHTHTQTHTHTNTCQPTQAYTKRCIHAHTHTKGAGGKGGGGGGPEHSRPLARQDTQEMYFPLHNKAIHLTGTGVHRGCSPLLSYWINSLFQHLTITPTPLACDPGGSPDGRKKEKVRGEGEGMVVGGVGRFRVRLQQKKIKHSWYTSWVGPHVNLYLGERERGGGGVGERGGEREGEGERAWILVNECWNRISVIAYTGPQRCHWAINGCSGINGSAKQCTRIIIADTATQGPQIARAPTCNSALYQWQEGYRIRDRW